jgi:hypothetical protein
MLEKLNKKIELPKFKLKKLSLPKLNIKKVKVISGGIVALDPYNKLVYNFADNTISKGNISFYDRKNFYISYIYLKDLIVGSIEINRAILEDDLKDAIEVAAYDELGLDSTVEYIIKYFEVHISNSQNRVFNVFAIPTYKLLEIFEDIGSIKHIDFLAPAPLLYRGLYKKEYLDRGKIDCFVHFDYDDAYLVIYNDGEYVYSKSLTHSLKKINEEFAKLLAQHIDEKEFFELLKHQGLMTTDSIVQKNLMKIFGDIFNYINDVLQYAKRSNNIENIDNFYITSKIGDIKGIVEFATNYTNIRISPLELKISKNSSEISLDPLVEIMIVYAKEYINEKDDRYNFSLFKKEPDFFTRPSGKLVKTIAASLILSLSYPIYQIYEIYMFEQQYNSLSKENQRLAIQVSAMKQALKNILVEKKSIEDKLKSKGKDLEFRTRLLQEIYNKKVNYVMKTKILNDLFKRVNKHNSKVEKVENHNREIILTVKSKKDKFITELIKDISIDKRYKVSTNLIKKDNNSSYYKSAIKVGAYGSF